MRTYRQVREYEPKIGAFLKKHADRLGGELPQGLWVCEEDGEPIIALTVYTEPYVRVSAIVDRPETRPAASLSKLASAFEEWALGIGVTRYCVVVHAADDDYRRILERRGGVEVGAADGWIEYLFRIDAKADDSDGIRPWAASDWTALRPLMKGFLLDHHTAGGDFPATRHNIEEFIRAGVRAAAQGDPTLLLRDEGKIIGFCLWRKADAGSLDVRAKVCVAVAQYVVPDHRRQGCSKRLSEAALAVARARGYERVDSFVLDDRGHKNLSAAGFRSAGLVMNREVGS